MTKTLEIPTVFQIRNKGYTPDPQIATTRKNCLRTTLSSLLVQRGHLRWSQEDVLLKEVVVQKIARRGQKLRSDQTRANLYGIQGERA